MEHINTIIIYLMVFFMVLGALDRILDQFGGSEKILSKIGLGALGRTITGAGKEFEEGFNAMGPVAMGMVGVIALTPVLKSMLAPLIVPLYTVLGADPSMFATTLLANDMGGYFLAREMADTEAAGLYSGLILGAVLGPTISFSIPVGIGLIRVEDRPYFALGVLASLVTVPLGCIAGGVVSMYSSIEGVNGEILEFTWTMILINLIPVVIFSLLVGLGLKLVPNAMIKGFNIFAKILLVGVTIGLVAAVIERLTGIVVINGLDPIFTMPGDEPGIDMRAIEVIGAIAILLLGAYPMVLLLTRWFEKPLVAFAGIFKIDATAAVGMIGALANILLMFQNLHKMSNRGKVLAVAFSCAAAWTFGDHLGFTAANKPDMIFAMVAAKLTAGITALVLAMFLYKEEKIS